MYSTVYIAPCRKGYCTLYSLATFYTESLTLYKKPQCKHIPVQLHQWYTFICSQARSPSGLQLPLTLKWRRCRDMPCGMAELQSVRLGEDVFVGGGYTVSLSSDTHTVYQYHPPTDQWIPLPRYEYVRFAMAVLTNRLALVGGYNTSTHQSTNQIAVWDKKWLSGGRKHPYPPMPTPRHSPAIATYDRWLVVAGGKKSLYGADLATVEVLDTTSRQWLSTSPLPVKCYNMTSAIVKHELFLMGGSLTTDTLVVSLLDLTQSSVQSAATNTSVQWRTLCAPPLKYSAAIAVHESVVAIGGLHGNDRSTAVHVYQPATNNWKKVGNLPSARSSCSCTLLPSGEILVAGGRDSNGKRTSRVDAAAL